MKVYHTYHLSLLCYHLSSFRSTFQLLRTMFLTMSYAHFVLFLSFAILSGGTSSLMILWWSSRMHSVAFIGTVRSSGILVSVLMVLPFHVNTLSRIMSRWSDFLVRQMVYAHQSPNQGTSRQSRNLGGAQTNTTPLVKFFELTSACLNWQQLVQTLKHEVCCLYHTPASQHHRVSLECPNTSISFLTLPQLFQTFKLTLLFDMRIVMMATLCHLCHLKIGRIKA